MALSGPELHSLPIQDSDLILSLIGTVKYIGLMGLSLSLILLIIRFGNLGTRLSPLLEQAPISFYAAGFSLVLAVSLVLRIKLYFSFFIFDVAVKIGIVVITRDDDIIQQDIKVPLVFNADQINRTPIIKELAVG